MDSGCICLWIKQPLTRLQKHNIIQLINKTDNQQHLLDVDFEFLEFNNPEVEKQITHAIGYIPNFQIRLYGRADYIFPMAETLLKQYGGYMEIPGDFTEEEINNIPGHCYSIDEGIYLNDWRFVSNYWNRCP